MSFKEFWQTVKEIDIRDLFRFYIQMSQLVIFLTIVIVIFFGSGGD